MLTEEKTRLRQIVAHMTHPGKGILAADESLSTITKRFQSIGLDSTEETRTAYRSLLFTAKDIEQYIAGVILFEETLTQKNTDGILLPELLAKRGIFPGIKVDKGLLALPWTSEKVTQGLDGLPARLAAYQETAGVKFAKWRAVFDIAENQPSYAAILANTHALARYASICQSVGVVPIVEPEILMTGTHSIERCAAVTIFILNILFEQLYFCNVYLPGMLLKPSMVLPGDKSEQVVSEEQVAEQTLEVLLNTVPAAVPGIYFLSGGQSPEQATAHLAAMHKLPYNLPWHLSFSYGRALQAPALAAWQGKAENSLIAQDLLTTYCQKNAAAIHAT